MTRRSAGDMADLWRYDDLCARLYADKRLPAGTRELALTLAWATLRDPERHNGDSTIARARRILGRAGREWRFTMLVQDDAPRYERPRVWDGPCDGPRVRPYVRRGYGYSDEEADRRTAHGTRCGTNTQTHVDEYDMVTGQVSRTWWFCPRHRADEQRVRAQLAARGTVPPAIPNRGGLLACYFRPDGVEKLYRQASRRWEPPYHGICADDWPVPGRDLVPRRPRLALIVGGLEASAPAACSPDAD